MAIGLSPYMDRPGGDAKPERLSTHFDLHTFSRPAGTIKTTSGGGGWSRSPATTDVTSPARPPGCQPASVIVFELTKCQIMLHICYTVFIENLLTFYIPMGLVAVVLSIL